MQNMIEITTRVRLPAIRLAVAVAGSRKLLGSAIGASHQTIGNWVKRGYCSSGAVIAIEKATGISRHDLRPDLYPQDVPAPAARRPEASLAEVCDDPA
jgi:DNA-binding transcriptional regulator YdaS (Cro superfamily)